jgi:hypothetical protein
LRGVILRLLDAFDDVLIQPLMPDRSVVALDVGILLRLAGLDGKRSFDPTYAQ